MPATRCLFMQMLVVTSIACELGTVGLAGVFLRVSASHQLPLYPEKSSFKCFISITFFSSPQKINVLRWRPAQCLDSHRHFGRDILGTLHLLINSLESEY